MNVTKANVLMRFWNPKAERPARRLSSDDVDKQVAEFLASGHKITNIPSSVTPHTAYKANSRYAKQRMSGQ